MKQNLNKKGFTIIEVVLVLAIAGLIFLMVFVALPRLQISQRDTQRREDVGAVATAITQYQANNGGKLPTASNKISFERDYLKSAGTEFKDPGGNDYFLEIVEYSSTKPSIDAVQINTHEVAYQKKDDGTGCTVTVNGVTKDASYNAATNTCDPAVETVDDNESGAFTGTIYIIVKAGCGETDGSLVEGKSPRSYAVGMRLEGAGYYCTDN